MGPWKFKYRDPGDGVVVEWAAAADANAALEEYRRSRGTVPNEDQALVETYAEATYLKYRSLRDEFAADAPDYPKWTSMRGKGRECFALLQARVDDGSRPLAGSMLLRSAWTGDVVVDFVGTNFGVTRYSAQRFPLVGVMLVTAAAEIAAASSAGMVWVETARHSHEWWSELLDCPHAFVKFDQVSSVLANLNEFWSSNGATYTNEE